MAGGNADYWSQFQQAPDPNQAINSGSFVPTPSVAAPTTPIDNTGVSGMGGTSPTPTAGASGDPWAYFDQLFPGTSLSPQDLLAHEADLKAHGITLIKNAEGLPGKVQLADGSAYDVIQGAGSGQNLKQRNQIAGPGGVPLGGGGGGANPYGFGGFGSFVTPQAEFTPPTGADYLNDPGAAWGLAQAHRMAENGAAAHGTLLNGRFQESLYNNDIGRAAQYANDIYNRAANTFGTNYTVRTGNQDRPFQKYYNLAQLGQTAASAS